MKKSLFIIALILLGTIGFSSAAFQDSLYCRIYENAVNVSLSTNNGGKCREYMDSLDTILIKELKDIKNIESLIEEGNNITFRINLKKEKIAKIQKIVFLKTEIYNAAKQFEQNILSTIKSYINNSLQADLHKYDNTLFNINNTRRYELSVATTTKLDTIEEETKALISQVLEVKNTENIDRFIYQLKKYIYLKQQFEGKWES